ncbi:5-deoxy-glucuronate isomerase [Streptomyces endophyticus]|uniref:5-deoxy-glucuronate isomerase n=1 Tax=Streptomyces endophyticus TaxID=714166 RepID=A0ABU6EZY1_9ACTN|nr:5-deoxy-glucuronate isomerase [Streptomyces endophyticus]MEB8336947.1 5-deoxy-glucuronate isomerase [Streptomyces endophyticus]
MTTRQTHECHLPAGSATDSPYTTDVTPRTAGWAYSSLRVVELAPGGRHDFDTEDSEWIVLPLSGSCTVAVDGDTFQLAGRESVFTGVTDFVYAPRDAHATLTTRDGGRFALTGARCDRRLPARYQPASAVPVELRGSGQFSRQVNNFAAAGAFACDKLIAVEVLTPGGNWSSFPPHKHDEERAGESLLEEIYYFEIAGAGGLGYQRVSPSGNGRGTDLLAEVHDRDTVLVPDGWHGPSVAAPGHDMYYLNVMAGPGAERSWLICDHPDHAGVRDNWDGRPLDPRLPLYTAPDGRDEPVPTGTAS